MNSGFRFENKIQQWLPEKSSLTLYCEGKEVGELHFDLSSYIGQKSKIEKLVLKSKDAVTSEERALIGDAATYPGAYLTFKIKVEPLDKQESSPSTNSLVKGKTTREKNRGAGRLNTTAESTNLGLNDSKNIEDANKEIEKLKLKY